MICTMLHCVRFVPLDIHGLLNDVFVSGLPALAGLPVLSQWSCSLHCVHASVCQTRAFGRCFVFAKSFLITCPVFLFLHFVFKNFQCPLKVKFLDWYTFLIKTLSPLLNCMLHYLCAVTALKINIKNKILCFCLQKSEMYLVLNII